MFLEWPHLLAMKGGFLHLTVPCIGAAIAVRIPVGPYMNQLEEHEC